MPTGFSRLPLPVSILVMVDCPGEILNRWSRTGLVKEWFARRNPASQVVDRLGGKNWNNAARAGFRLKVGIGT
jgi:hypothetical protein